MKCKIFSLFISDKYAIINDSANNKYVLIIGFTIAYFDSINEALDSPEFTRECITK